MKLDTPYKPNFCPGCGDLMILTALKQAITEMELEPHQVLMVEGIGCHGHIVNFLEVNHFEGLHGRPLPLAQGAKLANPNLHVFVLTGDGDGLGEGGNHFLHALRRNIDLTVLIFNNQRYSLTTGQASPTSTKGDKTKSTPFGLIAQPINPISLAINGGATFVARTFAGDIKHLTKTLIRADQHRGLSVVDILQPCVSFNKVNTYEFFRKRVYEIEQQKDYQPQDFEWALLKSQKIGEKIPIGIFYQVQKETYTEQIPLTDKTPLVQQSLEKIEIESAQKEFF